MLTANKRGPTLVPCQDPASAAEEFETQEAAFAKAAAAAESGELEACRDDRPLTGGKPAAALDAGGQGRPLASGATGAGTGEKGGVVVVVPPSQSAPGSDEGLTVAVGNGGGDGDRGYSPGDGKPGAESEAMQDGGVTVGVGGPVKYMTALG